MNNIQNYKNFLYENKSENIISQEVEEFDTDDDLFRSFPRIGNRGYGPRAFTFEEQKTIALFTGDAMYLQQKGISEFMYTTQDYYGIFKNNRNSKVFRVVKYNNGEEDFYVLYFTQRNRRYFKCYTLKSALYKIKELEKNNEN